MTASTEKFALLLDLAKENSGDKRRELLGRIADLFLADASVRTGADSDALDDIIGAVVSDLTAALRSELAHSLAASTLPLGRTMMRLAMDEIEIARPVIEQSPLLSQGDLLAIARGKSQDHLLAMTKRTDIGEEVASTMVAHGNDTVVAALLSNDGANIDGATYEKIAERARVSVLLHAPFIRRNGVPLELLNDLYAYVGTELRQEILAQYENVSPQAFDMALERSRQRMVNSHGIDPELIATANRQIDAFEAAAELNPMLLVRLMREGPKSQVLFLLAWARLADVEFSILRRLVEARDIDALALLCSAAGFDRALFLTLMLRIASGDRTVSQLEEFGDLYEQVDQLSAQRAVRFWKVRSKA